MHAIANNNESNIKIHNKFNDRKWSSIAQIISDWIKINFNNRLKHIRDWGMDEKNQLANNEYLEVCGNFPMERLLYAYSINNIYYYRNVENEY